MGWRNKGFSPGQQGPVDPFGARSKSSGAGVLSSIRTHNSSV